MYYQPHSNQRAQAGSSSFTAILCFLGGIAVGGGLGWGIGHWMGGIDSGVTGLREDSRQPEDTGLAEDSGLPVKYEGCDLFGKNCEVQAKFEDFRNCQNYRMYSNSLCDRVSRPGYVICKVCPGPRGCSQMSTSRCTK